MCPINLVHDDWFNAIPFQSRVRRQFLHHELVQYVNDELTSPTVEQRVTLINQAQILIGSHHVHIPPASELKPVLDETEKLNQFDPMLALTLLRNDADLAQMTRWDFLSKLCAVFQTLSDYHTRVMLSGVSKYVGFLPFLVEPVGRRLFVSHIINDFNPKCFVDHRGRRVPGIARGDEVVEIDGLSIKAWLQKVFPLHRATNPESQVARAAQRATVRPLASSLPPIDAARASLRFRRGDGSGPDVIYDLPWIYRILNQQTLAQLRNDAWVAEDLGQRVVVDGRREVCGEAAKSSRGHAPGYRLSLQDIGTERLAHARLFSIPRDDDREATLIADLASFLSDAQRAGAAAYLIDLRGNPGGGPKVAEKVLRLLVSRRFRSMKVQLRNSPLNLLYCLANSNREEVESGTSAPPYDFGRWAEAIQRGISRYTHCDTSVLTRAAERPKALNLDIPGAVLVDALTYSAAEVLAAGYQDHGGLVLGTAASTGGGGAAKVRSYTIVNAVKKYLESPHPFLTELPISFNVAIMRMLRRRRHDRIFERHGVQVSGRPIEITQKDLLHSNEALLSVCLRRIVESQHS